MDSRLHPMGVSPAAITVTPAVAVRWVPGCLLAALAVALLSDPLSLSRPQGSYVEYREFCRLIGLPIDSRTRVDWLGRPGDRPPSESVQASTFSVTYSGFSPQAQTAFQYAVDLMEQIFASPVTIRVQANWTPLGPNVLGSAGTVQLWRDGSNMAPGTWYGDALTDRLINTDANPASSDIQANFSSNFSNWNLATDGVPVSGKYDFVSVVMHELMHGLNFFGLGNVSAGNGFVRVNSFPSIYERFVVNGSNTSILNGGFPEGSAALAAQLQSDNLFWNGASGMSGNGGAKPKLYVPLAWSPGSSYSHLDDAAYPAGNANSLMTHAIGTAEVIHNPGPIASGMMVDMGWALAPLCAPVFTPSSQTNVPKAGGSLDVSVTIPNGCGWTAAANDSFLHVTAGASGSGNGVVSYSVDANPATSNRTGSLQIAGAAFSVTQVGNTIALAPATIYFAGVNNAGTLNPITPPQQVTVNFNGTGGTSWTASSNQSWAQVTGGAGSGGGKFTVSIANPGNVLNGVTHTTAAVTVTASNVTNSPRTVLVDLSLAPAGAYVAPYGQVDLPAQNATNQQGALALTGWALDDVGVQQVKVYRPCLAFDVPASCSNVGGNNLVYVADATFLAGARPDVEAAFPGVPLNYRGGWGVQILTNMLPHIPNQQLYGGQGVFPFYVYAIDFDSHMTLLGRSSNDHTPTSVLVNNDAIAKPFGTIDTPLLGETISASRAVFGWVITPDSNTVPDGGDILMATSGSGIVVYVDSMATAIVTYNQCRDGLGTPPTGNRFCTDDISSIFGRTTPAAPLTARSSNPTRFRNLDANRGAIGVYTMDTTLLSNGLHTIAWGVADTASRGEGIGSRFFTVFNGGSSVSAQSLAELLERPAAPRGSAQELDSYRVSPLRVSSRTGFDMTAPMRELRAGSSGVRTLVVSALGRVELSFGMPVSRGYLVANGELRDLPIGASLDRASGLFAWAPPAGYFGTYRLAFLAGADRIDVDIVVVGESPEKR